MQNYVNIFFCLWITLTLLVLVAKLKCLVLGWFNFGICIGNPFELWLILITSTWFLILLCNLFRIASLLEFNVKFMISYTIELVFNTLGGGSVNFFVIVIVQSSMVVFNTLYRSRLIVCLVNLFPSWVSTIFCSNLVKDCHSCQRAACFNEIIICRDGK